MRTVSFGMNISLDGCCDHTSFAPTQESAEAIYNYFTGMMDDVDLFFYGRVMYQLMFPYWADIAKEKTEEKWELEFAERLTSIDKVVVSKTLNAADVMENATIVSGNPVEELRKLKQQAGGRISVHTVSMLAELTNAGLIDEFHIVIHPVIVGKGRHLFDAGILKENLQLKLVESRVFKSGQVALHYVKA